MLKVGLAFFGAIKKDFMHSGDGKKQLVFAP